MNNEIYFWLMSYWTLRINIFSYIYLFALLMNNEIYFWFMAYWTLHIKIFRLIMNNEMYLFSYEIVHIYLAITMNLIFIGQQRQYFIYR